MIDIKDILTLHFLSIEDFGGTHGLRDEKLLLSAISRPYQTFDGIELYPTAFDKAAALGESLISNHPFIDGNKRIGLLAMLALLMSEQVKVTANQDDTYQLIIGMSKGEIKFDQIVEWLKNHTQETPS